ncbi:uncharacterized protein LOC142231349 [Haematobia irritans]|uniref:uncharacterized protein LOC142231349 n=1 Tax=Haematobia irritans TaxID=7368 RepID=UPI003F50B95C
MEYILENQLQVNNRGTDFTFETRTRKEVLDLTFSNFTRRTTVSNWRVSNEISYSDHKYIEFDVGTGVETNVEEFRNPRRTNWNKHPHLGCLRTPGYNKKIDSIEEIEGAANMVEKWLTRSFVRSCPTSRPLNNKHKAWWSKELMHLRRKSRRLYNDARRHGTEQLWNECKDCLKIFKKKKRKAKRMDFIRVIEQLSTIKDTARLRKFLTKQPKLSGKLQNSNGKWTESLYETIDL